MIWLHALQGMAMIGLGSDKNHKLQIFVIRQKWCACNWYISLNYFATSHMSRTNILHHSKYSFPLTFPLIPLAHFAPATPSRLQHTPCCDQTLDWSNAKYVVRYKWTGCCDSWAIIRTVTQGERDLMLLSLPPSLWTRSRFLAQHNTCVGNSRHWFGKLVTKLQDHTSHFHYIVSFQLGIYGKGVLFGSCWETSHMCGFAKRKVAKHTIFIPMSLSLFCQRGPFK